MSCIGDETLLLPIAFLHRSHYPSGKENDQEKDGENSDEGYEDAEVTRGGMGGGTLYAYDDTVTTAGESSAAIRSDRGGGTMVVDGGSYTTNGTGSPAIYSTADISAHDATLTANNSEAVCIEGANTIRLFDCSLSGNMQDNDQNDCTWNVILYQSMSGDSEEGNSTFEMTGGSLTAGNGGDGSCSMYIDSGSTWIVTGDSTVTNLYNAGTIGHGWDGLPGRLRKRDDHRIRLLHGCGSVGRVLCGFVEPLRGGEAGRIVVRDNREHNVWELFTLIMFAMR